ncbi:MAG: bifunctional adenosylcobinamide kinase/adenosylcobinamide-phosphate guanylyltransferase [Firmicutes bacterium]|nr:bifunctional adenosylcobinamide kinase/adenosylcobinamide-phosphate guanylyltransferase [Bacillota bacterium]
MIDGLVLVTGGSGSGKSAFAEGLAVKAKNGQKTCGMYYIAAMKPCGAEGESRIVRHRKQRAGKGFETVECYSVREAGQSRLICDTNDSPRVCLLECLSNLAANEIFDEKNMNAADDILDFIIKLKESCAALIVVTNEIFSDGVLYGEQTVNYIKILGELNRRLAERADSVFEVVCGIPVRIK